MNLTEKHLKSDYYFKGRILNLRKDTVELPNTATATREIIEHNGGVCVAALTDNDEVLFVKQYRCPFNDIILELPAGKRDSKDEDPFECGVRELKEETGAVAKKIIPLGQLYPSPAYCDEIIWLYAAVGLSFGDQKTDEDEFLEVIKIPLDKAFEMVLNGEIKDSKTQIAILKLKLLKDSKQI